MELCEDTLSGMGVLDDVEAANAARQMTEAVAYLHAQARRFCFYARPGIPLYILQFHCELFEIAAVKALSMEWVPNYSST